MGLNVVVQTMAVTVKFAIAHERPWWYGRANFC